MIVGDLEIRLRADIARLQADMTQARRVVTETQDKINAAANAMKTALAGIGIGAGLAEIIKMADEYAKFTAQLRLASTSAADYAASYDAVKRIARTSQQDLASTGVLYARIANGTRELGTTQKQVADITETVNLALRVSGATATESASAQLQLSQAFASGTLRGEEFNAVNEAAPRLMKALADGMGLPVGALKAMAGEGQITSNIMATVLPKALESLREESKNIQTIAGAFTVLKNEMLEFFGMQAQANGTVALITGAIRLLSENITSLVIVLKTLTAYQIGTWLAGWTVKTYGQVTAHLALKAATLSTLQSEVLRADSQVAQLAATQLAIVGAREEQIARLAQANANITAARAAIAASEAAGAQSYAMLIQRRATAELAVAEAARTAALAELAILGQQQTRISAQITAADVMQTAAKTGLAAATGVLSRAMGALRAATAFLGGPIGAIILLLGVAALAWEHFGEKAKASNEQAAESLEEATVRINKALEKQIEKHQAIIDLKAKGVKKEDAQKYADAYAQLAALERRRAVYEQGTRGTSASVALDFLREIDKEIAEVRGNIAKEQAKGAAAEKLMGQEAYNEWKKTYATREEQRAAEIADLKSRNLNAEQYADILGRINLKYADKDAAKALKQEENAYKTLIASIQEKLEANKLEALGFESMTDAQKMTVKLNAAILADKTKLNKADIERARVLIAQVAAEDAQLLSGKNVKKAVQELKDERDKDAASAFDEIEANKQAIATFGLTKAQIEALTLARMEERLARRGPQDLDLDEAEVNHLIRMIGLQKEKAATAATLGALDAGTDVTKAKELLDILTAVDNAAKDAASGMAASFGSVGSAIGAMTTALSGFSRDQAAIAAQLATSMKDAAGDPTKIARAQAMAAQQGAQAQVRSYGDMASAAKGFFKENSTGYKVMQTAEKAFRAYEMAMAVESMVKKIFFKETEVAANLTLNATKLTGEATTTAASTGLAATEASAWGITAVVKALASLPFPANLAAGAATLAAVVAIGAKLMGGMGGGSVSLSEQRQAATGTGTVLGDSSAKSESIAHSLAIMEKNSGLGLAYSASMASLLRQVVAGIGGLGGLLVRNAGVTGSVAPDSYGAAQNLFNSTLGKIPLIGGILGKVGGGVLGSIFGGKTTTLDTGLTLSKATLDSIAGRGVSSSQYTDTKTSGGWFSSDKNSTALNGLGPEANDQFTKIILGLRDTVQSSATALGIGGDAFNARLKTFVVDLGKISLKDLKGEEIQKALEAAFSKLGDDMASFGVAGLEQYQAVGEGYLETLVRVTNDYMQVSDVLAVLGKSFNTTGLGAVALSESLIAATGGLDKLTSGTSYFVENFLTEAERMAPITKSVNDAMGKLGQSGVTTVDQFKALVLQQDLSTAAGQDMYGKLLALAEPFKKAADYAAQLAAATGEYAATAKTASEIASERKDLQSQLDKLTLTTLQLRAKEREAIDASNRALFDQVAARQDLATAYATDSAAITSTIDKLTTFGGAIKTFRDGLMLGALSTLSPTEKAAEAQRQYSTMLAAARAGDATAQTGLTGAASTYLTASQAASGTAAQYAGNYARVQADMAIMSATVGSQLTAAQAQQIALDKQVSGLITLNDSVNAGAATVAQAIASLGVLGVKQINGSHAGGLTSVPYDGYTAELHAGERVLTAFEARNYSSQSGGGSDAVVAEIRGLREDNRALREELTAFKTQSQAENVAIVQSVGKVARLAQRWDDNGLLVRATAPIPTKEVVTA